MTDPAVLRHVVESIGAASAAHAEGARLHVAHAGAPVLERLAMRLGGAQHAARPRTGPRAIVIVAGDHGAGDPGLALGAAHPTVVAAHAIADGTAAVAHLARVANAPIVLVDAGVREPEAMPAAMVRLGRAPSGDLAHGPAMTIVDAAMAIEAGIALALSLGDDLALVCIGALGVGSEVSAAALLGAVGGAAPRGLGDEGAEAAGARGAAWARSGFRRGQAASEARRPVGMEPDLAAGLEVLAEFGGPETGVLAGLMLAAASTNVPVVLDSFATGAAALVASVLAPRAVDSMIAAHAGTAAHPRILAHLGLAPLFDVGLGHGDGTGAAMAIPHLDQVAALCARR